MVFPNQNSTFGSVYPRRSRPSQAWCHTATCTCGPISGQPVHPECLQYSISVWSTLFSPDLAVHVRMWYSRGAESLLTGTKCEPVPVSFTFYFHITAMMDVSCLSFSKSDRSADSASKCQMNECFGFKPSEWPWRSFIVISYQVL